MPFVRFDQMTPAQKGETFRILKTRKAWKGAGFDEMRLFEFWVNKDGRVSRRGGHHQPTPEYVAALERKANGEDVRVKGDLRGFKTADFHLNREPV